MFVAFKSKLFIAIAIKVFSLRKDPFNFQKFLNVALHLCWFVCVVEKRGRQLNTGFLQQAVQREAHMANYPVTQKSEI